MIRWGTIVSVDFEPVVGSEANKVRPALVVSNDEAAMRIGRTRRGLLTVLPITSNIKKVFAFQVLIPDSMLAGTGLDEASKIQAEQIRTIDVMRIRGVRGELPGELTEPVREAVMLHLGLDAGWSY